jgi:hypothetical protein
MKSLKEIFRTKVRNKVSVDFGFDWSYYDPVASACDVVGRMTERIRVRVRRKVKMR